MKIFLRTFLISALIALSSPLLFSQTATPPAGSGTAGDPYRISSLANLYWLTQNPGHWDKHYLQTANIDASATVNWNGGEGWEPLGSTQTEPFEGVYDGDGYIISNLFIDRDDGDQGFFGVAGHNAEIRNLGVLNADITGTHRLGALAGYLYQGALAENCNSSGVINSTQPGRSVGGLAGTNIGTIESCSSSATVNGKEAVGGLVGTNHVSSNIRYSYSEGVVNSKIGDGENEGHGGYGGLAGANWGGVYLSYSTASVYGNNGTGGLVGRNFSLIVDSYSTGNIEGTQHVGGLAGYHEGFIRQSYSTGIPSGSEGVGGLIGTIVNDPEVTLSFWDTSSSETETSAAGAGKTTVEMIDPDTFSEWDFADNWSILSGETYPFLQWQIEPGIHNYPYVYAVVLQVVPAAGGTTQGAGGYEEGDPVIVTALPSDGYVFVNWTDKLDNEVSNQEYWQFDMPGENVRLRANFAPITLSVEIEPVGAGGTVTVDPAKSLYNEGEEVTLTAETRESWIFINWTDEEQNELSDQESFVYTMPGHAVTLAANFEHLFGGGEGTSEEPWLIETAEELDNIRQFLGAGHADKHFRLVADINLDTDPWNTGQGWVPIGLDKIDQFQGTLDGDGKKITGLFIEQPTSGGLPTAAGLFESLNGAVVKNLAIENADIFAAIRAGVLAGMTRNSALIENCYSAGTITVHADWGNEYAGGLVGQNRDSRITGSHSSVTINGNGKSGGLVGENLAGEIINSYSTGIVEGKGNVGGLAGVNEGGSITGSFSTGDVTNTGNSAGGLVGWNTGSNAEIKDSYSVSRVKGISFVGGLTGVNVNSASIINCYSAGSVYGSLHSVGGLAGSSGVNEVVENSFWDIETSGQEESAGGDGATGYTTDFMTSSDLYVSGGGWDFDQVWDIIANNTYPFHKWQVEPGAHNYPPQFYMLTLETDPEGAGIAEDAKDYPAGGYVPVSVKPNEGFRFDEWIDDQDQQVSTETEFVYTMPERNVTLTAKFTPVNLTVEIVPAGGGEVEISPVKNYYDIGDEVTLTAKSAEGFGFVNWTDEAHNVLGETKELVYTVDQETVVLYANFVEEFAGGSGSEIDPWLIETVEHLDNVRNYTGTGHSDKHFTQIADIWIDSAPWNEGEGWEPIGTGPVSFFQGTYDGGGHRIAGIYINRPDTDYQGLFSQLAGGALVENLWIDAHIYGGSDAGGLAGCITDAVVRNIMVSGVVEGNARVGLLAGWTGNSIIENCSTDGGVNGRDDVGGLAGMVFWSDDRILYCHADIHVTGEGINVGGLVGRNGNLSTDKPVIKGSSSTGFVSNNGQGSGGLVGRNHGIIEQSYSDCKVDGRGWFTGGLVGYLDHGSVAESYSSGEVTGAGSDESYAGGLAGIISNGTVVNSYSTSRVIGYNRVGGLAGQISSGSITGSYSTGKVEGTSDAGGLIGHFQGGMVENSYWNTETSWQTESAAGEGKTTVEMLKAATFEDWDFAAIWGLAEDEAYPFHQWQTEPQSQNYPELYDLTINVIPQESGTVEGDGPRPGGGLILLSAQPHGGVIFTGWTDEQGNEIGVENGLLFEMPAADVTLYAGFEVRFGGGQGTEEEPWLIETAEHLDNIRLYLEWENGDKHFRQVADIDLGTSPWNEGEGWEPIGISWDSFYGTYDGNGLIIDGLYINRPGSNNAGLFGYLQSAEIIGVNIVNASVAGSQNVGIIAGHLGDNSSLTGSFSSGEVEGWRNVGGLVGNSFGNSAIEYSYSSAGVIGTGNNVGVLAGTSIYGSVIKESFSTGYAVGNNYVGGLVGNSGETSVIENSYSTAGTIGSGHVGGLAGEFTGEIIRNSYSTGTVHGENNSGGLIGSPAGTDIQNSYWNTESSGRQTSAGGEGKSTAEMISAATFAGWDFAGTWSINEGGTYPWLAWQQQAAAHNYPAEVYTLTLIADPQESGTAEGGGSFPENGPVVITAAPDPGYYFGGWADEGGNIVSGETTWIFAMPSEDITLTATFLPMTITVSVSPPQGGSVEISPEKEIYEENEGVGLIATPNEGYGFAGWTCEEGSELYAGESWYFLMPGEALSVTANFVPFDYTLDIAVSPEGSGTVTASPQKEHYTVGDQITLTASAAEEYRFIKWAYENGDELSTETEFTFTMPAGNAVLTALFDLASNIEMPRPAGIIISPNPAADIIVVGSDEMMDHVSLIDIGGQMVMQKDVNGLSAGISVESLPSGVYFVRIEISGKTVTKRIVVSR